MQLACDHLDDDGEVLLVKPTTVSDQRGFFTHPLTLADLRWLGIPLAVAYARARSLEHALRGLHYHRGPSAPGRLVSVMHGTTYAVAVDARAESPHYLRGYGVTLSADEPAYLWVPPGFAHGTFTLSPSAVLYYGFTSEAFDVPEAGLPWDDPALALEWPIPSGIQPILSARDRAWRPVSVPGPDRTP